jgi:adenine-specific DNA-methyltransferase
LAAIHDLITQVEDEVLRSRLAEELSHLTKEKTFGLVFETHLPELTPLYAAKVVRGATVARRKGPITDLWRVLSVARGHAQCIHRVSGQRQEMDVMDLVVVRQFGEPIFPSLVPVDRVANGPEDGPRHALIEADNYHALQLLEYLYAGQVDCIYIDPPYNSRFAHFFDGFQHLAKV